MMFLRSFARPVLLAWLLVFALILAGPASVYARVEMLNGRDGVEGDPGDSHDYTGGGGDYSTDGNQASVGIQPAPRIFYLPILILVDPQLGTAVMVINFIATAEISQVSQLEKGGAK